MHRTALRSAPVGRTRCSGIPVVRPAAPGSARAFPAVTTDHRAHRAFDLAPTPPAGGMDLFGAGECETHLAGFGQEPCVDPLRDVGPVVLGNQRGISLKELLVAPCETTGSSSLARSAAEVRASKCAAIGSNSCGGGRSQASLNREPRARRMAARGRVRPRVSRQCRRRVRRCT